MSSGMVLCQRDDVLALDQHYAAMAKSETPGTVFGTNLKRLRKAKGWSLNKLADEADLNKGYISELERGVKDQPSIDYMVKLAKALNVSTTDFLDDADGFERQVADLARRVPKESRDSVLGMLRGLAARSA